MFEKSLKELENLARIIREGDKNLRELLDESKFVTMNVQTSVLTHKDKTQENR